MQEQNFDEALANILTKDARYHREAYLFVREALDYTQREVQKSGRQAIRHVTGQELLAGIRAYALQQYGPLALLVLNEWGVKSCEDFGEIVFNLVEHHVLAKTDTDSRADFRGVYDFEDAFRKPFLPASSSTPSAKEIQSPQG
jgi:uncharacterized repeat protein (TIGR04138 family)